MSSSDNVIELNVGGVAFQTLKSTLTKHDGFFKIMLETDVPLTKDSTDTIFIDRDPAHFRLILNFMRDGHVELPELINELKEVRNEAQYFLLDRLVDLCDVQITKKTRKEVTPKMIRNMAPSDVVELNIGGTVFKTKKYTLTKINGFWKTLVTTEAPIKIDETGAIFVDRSPKHFGIILNFMRYGDVKLPDLKDGKFDLNEIYNDATFYKLEVLASAVWRKLNNIRRF